MAEGRVAVTEGVALPLSRIFIIFLALVTVVLVYLLLFKTRSGLRIRAVTQNRTMAGAAGINTNHVDAYTFCARLRPGGHRRQLLHMLASTGPTTGQAYIVDTFIVVVFGGVESLIGTVASAFIIGQMQSWFEYSLSGSMARASILLLVIVVLYFRPNGLLRRR